MEDKLIMGFTVSSILFFFILGLWIGDMKGYHKGFLKGREDKQ